MLNNGRDLEISFIVIWATSSADVPGLSFLGLQFQESPKDISTSK